MRITKAELISKPKKVRRHLVILGAGASAAAFPDGDANGKRLPTMDNLIKMLDLEPILLRSGLTNMDQNFEAVYSKLYEHDPESPFVKEIEGIVYTYFKDLRIPERPTLYDHLVMALRPKDIIATFNWDPFLFDAWNRTKDKVPVPEILHLHGNVQVAHCPDHPTYGEHGMVCPKCQRELIPTPLLYPITKKDYSENLFIKTEWEILRKSLREAITVTILGYSAPISDKEAIDLMKKAWDKDDRFIERIEIIDIKNKEELWKQWDPFIVRTYFDHEKDFYESRLSRYPRRSCEALIEQTAYGHFVEENPIPKTMDFNSLFSWLKPFIEAESSLDAET